MSACKTCKGLGSVETHKPDMLHFETDDGCPEYHFTRTPCPKCGEISALKAEVERLRQAVAIPERMLHRIWETLGAGEIDGLDVIRGLKERAESAEARLAEAVKDLREWSDYWGCEDPHDGYVQASVKGFARQLGIEQARANTAEAKLAEMVAALGCSLCPHLALECLEAKNAELERSNGFETALAEWKALGAETPHAMGVVLDIARTSGVAAIERYKAAEAKVAELHEEKWICFHCGFETAHHAEAQAHFGDRDDASEFTPTCTWWAKLTSEERAQEIQDLRKQITAEQEENSLLRTRIEGLEYRVDGQLSEIRSFKPFRQCASVNEIFHLYDSMEGRALADEAALAKAPSPERLDLAADEVAACCVFGSKRETLCGDHDVIVTELRAFAAALRERGKITP